MDALTLILIIVVGFFLGIVGAIIGSTLLILTPFFHFLGLPLHTALGTAKVSVLGRELVAISEYNKKKLINYKIMGPFLLSGVVFAFIGSSIIVNLNESILKVIVAIFMVVFALIFLFKPNMGLKEKKIEYSRKTVIHSVLLAAPIGFYQGIYGGGSNVFVIMAFISLFGNTFLKAVANSKVPNFVFALASVSVFIWKGLVDWSFAIPLLIATCFGSYFGAKLAIKKGNKFIRALFVGLVIIMAIKLLFF